MKITLICYCIGGDFIIYVVKSGDSLFSISDQTGVPMWKITYDNQLMNQDQLAVGQALLIIPPGESGSIRGDMYVTGYAYPFVEPYILEQAFPAINELLIFSYGFTFEGELVPPLLDDTWMIETAYEEGVEPILVLTPFSEGTFNNELVKVLSENQDVQDRLIMNLLETVEQKGFAGVDVDFEYILPEDRVGYAEFVGRLRRRMNAQGYQVSVALAPKTSADQPGLLYEGMDYALLGENADHVFLMTYEWGYTYGPPMAVAPLNKVREVVEYALTEIPREKILMGIPNYGYDWTLPYERGITKARLIGNVEAVRIAVENGAAIQFDEISMSPHFTYVRDGIFHEVWFEDVRSIEAKLNMAKEFELMGVGYWNLMRPFRANWLLLEK
ncbi:LysM peptidoglycan-binding domain-containing protein [Faecalicatena sp. AGMB00832]|uniref:LysM peptidoglycan-binding domain-containing protein n=1 Tax=Faecalicatena faecalis TaxID=2726362 RepID=A0ABS6D3I0_9FIRM|nr:MULTISPECIES: glycosyl hydrolase family 18 protein [Faecalicatena]MBU3876046.1 LysM peptidoglycan-binding domain-containing protein [Faecalicatena faecalis]MCI6468281.1 glycosyl hydrolase family 18 protein [Faecalicatena sp.]MDY5620535.1 glycosyl hydrolase family 18 protein [Lachnospiraceae bacterium]